MDQFRANLLKKYTREDLLKIIEQQNPDLILGINRIEYVFKYKLTHLTWDDGTPITSRPVTNEELALLIDEPFVFSQELANMNLDEDMQRHLHIAKDSVSWSRFYLKLNPRVYQILIMRYPHNRKLFRAGRRLGKTFSLAMILLHYAFTHNNARCIIVTPKKDQGGVIYKDILKMVDNAELLAKSITRRVTSPQYAIEINNGSTIRFFSAGTQSKSGASVVRGQEAHILVLDELDYMGTADIEALLPMLQKTSDEVEEKILIGASTPTGQRTSPFFKMAHSPKQYKTFWFPSLCNVYWNKEMEQEMKALYPTEMGYRHEIEADWGEDAEGVYPRKYIEAAMVKYNVEAHTGWRYKDHRAPTHKNSFFVFGVDWNKVMAGVNIVILEWCHQDYEDPQWANKLRVYYREEIASEEYTYTKAVQRIIELNNIFNPTFIYIDKGYGEMQMEMLHDYGVKNPVTGLRKKVKGINFGESIEVRDPSTKIKEKKPIKPFMVDNLRSFLEKDKLRFPAEDLKLEEELSSYIVASISVLGRLTYAAGGEARDDVHDALMLACLAITQNYDDLLKESFVKHATVISGETFSPLLAVETGQDQIIVANAWGDSKDAPVRQTRAMAVPLSRSSKNKIISRKLF